jgi:ribosomal protein S18 acetylase RimI-like enzyme
MQPDEVEIIPLTPGMTAEVAAVTALLEAQLDEHALPIPTVGGGIVGVVAGMLERPERGFILCAKAKERVIGVAYLPSTWTLEHGGPVIWLDELYIVPELRNSGIGGKLLREAMRQAAARGYVVMDLEVEESHTRAANLYRRTGFSELPRRRFSRSLVK